MSNKKISQLDELSTITDDDLTVVVDLTTLTTRKASMANLKTFFVEDIPSRVNVIESAPKCFSEVITLSAADIANKEVILTKTPLSGYNVSIQPSEGCAQFQGPDFDIAGNVLVWEGLGLDGLLVAGDTLQITYFY